MKTRCFIAVLTLPRIVRLTLRAELALIRVSARPVDGQPSMLSAVLLMLRILR